MADDARKRVDGVDMQPDGYGIFEEDGWYRIIAFSQQGEGVFLLPADAAGPLGRALLEIADEDGLVNPGG